MYGTHTDSGAAGTRAAGRTWTIKSGASFTYTTASTSTFAAQYRDIIIENDATFDLGTHGRLYPWNSTSVTIDGELTGSSPVGYIYPQDNTTVTGSGTISCPKFYTDTTAGITLTIEGSLTLDGCELELREPTSGSSVIDTSGMTSLTTNADVNYTANAGTLSWTTGTETIFFNGTQTLDFGGLSISNVEVTGDVTLAGNMGCGNFDGLAGGSLDMGGAYTLAASGDLDWANGFSVTPANGCTVSVGGNFTCDAQDLTAATAPWFLNVTGTAVAAGIGDVSYSDASGGTEIDATAGPWTDSGNTDNWSFSTGIEIAGVVGGVSTINATFGMYRSMAGDLTSVSTIDAARMTFYKSVAGDVVGTSVLTGHITNDLALAGIVVGDSSVIGNLSYLSLAIAGTINGVSTIVGVVGGVSKLFAVIAAESTITANLGNFIAIAGNFLSESSIIGNLLIKTTLEIVVIGPNGVYINRDWSTTSYIDQSWTSTVYVDKAREYDLER
jgi:hypothetical protein